MERKRLTRSAVGVAVACLTIAALAPSATAAPEFELSGTVLDRDGAPLASICVTTEAGSTPTGSTVTDGNGTYVVPIDAGSHTVRFTDCATTPTHVTQWWSGRTSPNDAEPVTIIDGDLTLGPVTMQTGVSVSGTVHHDGTGLADASVHVAALDGSVSSGAITGPDGTYRTGPLPDGEYSVRFDGPAGSDLPVQFWKSAWTASSADRLSLSAADSTEHGSVDAWMVEGAQVLGTVTDTAGSPLGGICVAAYERVGSSLGDRIGDTTTSADGSYRIGALPPVDAVVELSDCNGSGYGTEWYLDAGNPGDARVLHLGAGVVLSDLDAQLSRGETTTGTVSGRVTDRSGPLGEVCVQASDDRGVVASTRTEDDGDYRLELARTGSFRVQFVDCSDQPDHVGVWWGGGTSRSSAVPLHVELGEDVHDVSVELADGAPGTVGGRVTNVRGEPMAGICVVAYLAFGPVRIAATATDGTFTVTGVGSGTWALGYVACGKDDVELRVVDPSVPSVAYPAQWFGGEVLHVPDDDTGPDPIEQGAELVDVVSGERFDADFCFGCAMVAAEVASTADDVATFSFTAPELLDGADAQGAGGSPVEAQADAVPLTYQVSCSAPGAPTLTSAVATSVDTTLGVVGLVGGSSYECTVDASVDGIVVANSATMPVTAAAAPPPGSAGQPSATNASGRPPAALAFTGSSLVRWLTVSLLLLAGGLLLAGLTPARSPVRRRRRP